MKQLTVEVPQNWIPDVNAQTTSERPKPILVKLLFAFGETVFIKTDPEQLPHQIVSIKVEPGISVLYALQGCKEVSWHYDFEISTERDEVLRVG